MEPTLPHFTHIFFERGIFWRHLSTDRANYIRVMTLLLGDHHVRHTVISSSASASVPFSTSFQIERLLAAEKNAADMVKAARNRESSQPPALTHWITAWAILIQCVGLCLSVYGSCVFLLWPPIVGSPDPLSLAYSREQSLARRAVVRGPWSVAERVEGLSSHCTYITLSSSACREAEAAEGGTR